jgi:hypothetical protein
MRPCVSVPYSSLVARSWRMALRHVDERKVIEAAQAVTDRIARLLPP